MKERKEREREKSININFKHKGIQWKTQDWIIQRMCLQN